MSRSLLAAVAALVLVSCFSGYSEDAPRGALRVRRGRFVRELTLTGELEAARGEAITVPMLPQWQSSIKWLAADGAEVKQGERVAELDNSTFTTDLDSKKQTELQVLQEIQQKDAEAKADLEQKQLDYDTRKSELDKAKIDAAVPRDILSLRDYQDRQIKLERARTEFAKAFDILKAQKKALQADRRNLELRLEKAQREIHLAEQAIDSVVLRTPRDGIVIVRDHPWEGRKIQTGDTVWVGFPLALIPEMSSMRVSAALADVDDGRVAVGMPASVVLDGYPGTTFSGKIAGISAVAQETSRQSLRRAFKVVVTLDRIDAQRMRPGLSARVVVRAQTINDALIAPRAAFESSPGKTRAVLPEGRKVDVTLGPCSAQECVVTSGLVEGQRLEAANG
ncbi:MAG TPA: efflux RND transporter periplasmic adaptor subunit [Thermoanaerobaculia bacterium]|nr:efflux RND transporter periplasmic adaptor subunit [Thermoanaerobaculia bacterium]